MRIEVTLQGGTEMLKHLRALPAAVSTKAQKVALLAGAEPIRAHAEALAPRDTTSNGPHLADNIVIGIQSARKLRNAGLSAAELDVAREGVVVEVGPAHQPTDHFYGYFQEHGTALHAAQPFMRPAFDSEHRRSVQVILTSLWGSIRKALPQSFGGRSTTGGNL